MVYEYVPLHARYPEGLKTHRGLTKKKPKKFHNNLRSQLKTGGIKWMK